VPRFRCPSCKSVLNAPEGRAGRTAPCPGCGRALVIPGQPPPQAPPPPTPRRLWPRLGWALAGAGALLLLLACGGGVAVLGWVVAGGSLDGRSARPQGHVTPAAHEAPADDMSLKTYKATMPPEPKAFTLVCEISDYYGFRSGHSRDVHHSVLMREPNGTEVLHGYAEKDGVLGRKLFALLRDGKEHSLRLRLRYADRESSGSVEIVGLVE
jgi:hypothetical protein